MSSTKVLRILQAIIFLVIIGLSIFTRFYHLENNPGIYSDEGTVLNVVNNLLEGRSEYLGVQGSLLFLGRMPVFPYFLKMLAKFFPLNLLTLRFVTASAGVLTVAVIFFCLRDIFSKDALLVPYFASLFLALDFHGMLFSRMGFGYNLLAPLTVVVYWMLWKSIQTREWKWLFIGAFLGSWGVLVELAYMGYLLFIALIAVVVNWRKSPWIILILALPFTLYFLWSWFTFGNSFLFDWKFTSLRINAPLLVQLGRTILVYVFDLLKKPIILLGMFGFFLLSDKRLSLFSFASFFVPLIILLRTVSIGYQSFYYVIPYYPLVFIGIGVLSAQGTNLLISLAGEYYDIFLKNRVPVWISEYLKAFLTVSLLLVFSAPFFAHLYNVYNQVAFGFRTDFDPLMIPVSEVRSVTDYVNREVSPDDLVLASPAIAWAIHAHATDYQISIAVNQGSTIHFPLGIPRERMRFETDYHQAKYWIVDSIILNWGQFVIPEAQQMLKEVQSKWIPVYQTSVVTVYQNPFIK